MDMKIVVQVESKNGDMLLPQKPGDYGFDLRINEEIVLPAGGHVTTMVDVKLQVYVEDGNGIEIIPLVLPRSGMGSRFSVSANIGLIDGGFTGKIGITLFSHNTEEMVFKAGTRVAQVVFLCGVVPVVEYVEKLVASTERGEDGFGSTGI